jgi:hypothetical protein
MIRRFRDFDSFNRYKEGKFPLDGGPDGQIRYYDETTRVYRCISDQPELYELLVRTVEEYYRCRRKG